MDRAPRRKSKRKILSRNRDFQRVAAMSSSKCHEEVGASRPCGQGSLISHTARRLAAANSENGEHIIDRFKPRDSILTLPFGPSHTVADFRFDPDTRTYECLTPALGSMKLVKTAYNGEVHLPVTASDYLIANVMYGDVRVQFAMYDAKNASESLITRTYLSNNVGVEIFVASVNKGLFPTARTGASLTTTQAVAEANSNAYFAILKYYEMLVCLFKRPGLVLCDHCVVSLANIRFTNAFWSGFCMFFGNGGDRSVPGVLPLTAVDVCGHELTHGLQTFTTEFDYQGESGALNESIADVFGTLLEFYVGSKLDTPDWTIGEAFRFVIRDFANPKLRKQPNYHGGEFWVSPTSDEDEGGVHTNSGVANYMCYLAVKGVEAPFQSDGGEHVVAFPPHAGFNLQDYVYSVYRVLTQAGLSVNASLSEFADALVKTVRAECSETAAAHVLKCAQIVGLAPPSVAGALVVGPVEEVDEAPPVPLKFAVMRSFVTDIPYSKCYAHVRFAEDAMAAYIATGGVVHVEFWGVMEGEPFHGTGVPPREPDGGAAITRGATRFDVNLESKGCKFIVMRVTVCGESEAATALIPGIFVSLTS